MKKDLFRFLHFTPFWLRFVVPPEVVSLFSSTITAQDLKLYLLLYCTSPRKAGCSCAKYYIVSHTVVSLPTKYHIRNTVMSELKHIYLQIFPIGIKGYYTGINTENQLFFVLKKYLYSLQNNTGLCSLSMSLHCHFISL